MNVIRFEHTTIVHKVSENLLKNFNEFEKWINLCAPIKEHYSWILHRIAAQIYISETHLLSNAIMLCAHTLRSTLCTTRNLYIYLWFKLFLFFLRYEKLQNIRFLNYSARRTEVVCSARKLRFISSLTFSPYIYKCMHVAMLILDCQTCH